MTDKRFNKISDKKKKNYNQKTPKRDAKIRCKTVHYQNANKKNCKPNVHGCAEDT